MPIQPHATRLARQRRALCLLAAPLLALAATQAVAAAPTLPVNTYKSLQVTTPGFTNRFARHLSSIGITSAISTESSRTDRLDATFRIAPGLADPSCYSFEANNYPGRYLRHNYGAIVLGQRSTDLYPGIFDPSATWCAVTGLSGADVSFQSKNLPGHYLRHKDGTLLLTDASVNPGTFAKDASWKVVTALTDAVPTAYPSPTSGVKGAGALPAIAAKVENLGEISTSADNSLPRDIGFSGVVNGQIVWSFADTFSAANGDWICSSNSAGLGSFGNPLKVSDKNLLANGCTPEWVKFTDGELSDGGLSHWANWTTNVIEVAPNQGLVWYGNQKRGDGTCNCVLGTGVATVTASESGPVATRIMGTQWNAFEPRWGDIGVAYNPADGKVYVMGHGPDGPFYRHIYLARAPGNKATEVGAYEYYDKSTNSWGSTRFTDDGRMGTVKVSEKQALFGEFQVGQSYPFWSNHFNSWLMVYGDDYGFSDIHVMSAPKLEGPWTRQADLGPSCPANEDCSGDAAAGRFHYGIAGHPEFDPSGKTLLVTWTRLPNRIHAKRITWQ